jgi:hypothetical protein
MEGGVIAKTSSDALKLVEDLMATWNVKRVDSVKLYKMTEHGVIEPNERLWIHYQHNKDKPMPNIIGGETFPPKVIVVEEYAKASWTTPFDKPNPFLLVRHNTTEKKT